MSDESKKDNKNLILGIAALAGGAFLLLGRNGANGGGGSNGNGGGSGSGDPDPEEPHQVGDDPFDPAPDPALGSADDYIQIGAQMYEVGNVGGFALSTYLALLRERGVQRQACEEKAMTIRSIIEEGGACDYKHNVQQCPDERTFFELGSRDDSPFFLGFDCRQMLYDAIDRVTYVAGGSSAVPEIMHNSDWQWIVEHKYEATSPKWGNPYNTLRSVVNTMLSRFNNTSWTRATARTGFANALNGSIKCGATGAHWRDNGFTDSLGWDGNDLCYCNGAKCFQHIKSLLLYLWDIGAAIHRPEHHWGDRVGRGRALWIAQHGLCYTYTTSEECEQFRNDVVQYCRNLEIDNMDDWREYIQHLIEENGGLGDNQPDPNHTPPIFGNNH